MIGPGITTGFGISGHTGAESGRLMKDMPTLDLDPVDVYAADGRVLAARGDHLARNNSYARAMINAAQAGIVGPRGLVWKSTYDSDPTAPTDAKDARIRAAITRYVSRGMARIDASNLLNYRQINDALVYGKAVHGEAFFVRVMKHRPGAPTLTCWRHIHASRVCNPRFAADTATMRQGIVLDADGDPVGIHVANVHPGRLDPDEMKWTYVPLFDDTGEKLVIWHAARTEPGQLRGIGWFAPIMQLLAYLGMTAHAHVVAKRLQACMGMIVFADDPVAAARADRNGRVFTRNTVLEPGKTYYLKRGADVKPFNFSYDGKDYLDFTDGLMQAMCAAFGPGIPAQFVMQQLTKSNMASSRAALMQAYLSFQREQFDQAESLETMVRSLIREGVQMGRLPLPTDTPLDLAAAGQFIPPQRLVVDPAKEATAAQRFRTLGISDTTLAQEYGGYDLDAERQRRVDEQAADEAAGLSRIEPDNQTIAGADDDDDGNGAGDDKDDDRAEDDTSKESANNSTYARPVRRATKVALRQANDLARGGVFSDNHAPEPVGAP